jgi:hypothetical protein
MIKGDLRGPNRIEERHLKIWRKEIVIKRLRSMSCRKNMIGRHEKKSKNVTFSTKIWKTTIKSHGRSKNSAVRYKVRKNLQKTLNNFSCKSRETSK